MHTSIQVDSETRVILERLKRAYNARTYDEAILRLVKAKSSSFYGALAGKNKVPMAEILRCLRDEDD